jgi:hypothetical protein
MPDNFKVVGLATDPDGTAFVAGGAGLEQGVCLFEWPPSLPDFPELE